MIDDMPNLIFAWPFKGWNLKDNPDGTKSRVDFIGGQWSKNKAYMPGLVKYVRADLYEAERQRAEKAEAKRDEYRCIANAYAAWAGDILELLEERLGELDTDIPSDEGLKRLIDRAEAGIASEVRHALRQDEGDDE